MHGSALRREPTKEHKVCARPPAHAPAQCISRTSCVPAASLELTASDRVTCRTDREAKRILKANAKKLALMPQESEPSWQPVDGLDGHGLWYAIATDGIGHHDGTGTYTVRIPLEDFGDKLFLGGDLRFDADGGRDEIFKIPAVMPQGHLDITFWVCPEGRMGRYVSVTELEVRAPP